jgi:hypothetical protein
MRWIISYVSWTEFFLVISMTDGSEIAKVSQVNPFIELQIYSLKKLSSV